MERTEQAADEVCGYCGKAEVDDVKLKKCACNLVKYCSIDCQKNHRPQHKKVCKKRLAEIHDDNLFSQPDEGYLGECPICCLALPLDLSKSTIKTCCSKRICKGCSCANMKRELEQGQHPKCPYCRDPVPEIEMENEIVQKRLMKRAKANDPIALFNMGVTCFDEGDFVGAFDYFTKAAALGDAMAHFNLSIMYHKGEGVERDEKKKVHHLEEAAIGGHPDARYNLGAHEGRSGRYDRAVKHFIIAAKLGDDGSLDQVKKCFHSGVVSKEDYAAALRGHQAAVDATKSEQRDAAYAFLKRNGLL
jgi:tetratricopeptide (TPR) repeat protein